MDISNLIPIGFNQVSPLNSMIPLGGSATTTPINIEEQVVEIDGALYLPVPGQKGADGPKGDPGQDGVVFVTVDIFDGGNF